MIPIFCHELETRNVTLLEETAHIRIHNLMKIVHDNEYLELVLKKDRELEEEERRELKFFYPYYLSAVEWSKDIINTTLKDLYWY